MQHQTQRRRMKKILGPLTKRRENHPDCANKPEPLAKHYKKVSGKPWADLHLTTVLGIRPISTTTVTVNDKRYEILLDSCSEFPLIVDAPLARAKHMTGEVVDIQCSNHDK